MRRSVSWFFWERFESDVDKCAHTQSGANGPQHTGGVRSQHVRIVWIRTHACSLLQTYIDPLCLCFWRWHVSPYGSNFRHMLHTRSSRRLKYAWKQTHARSHVHVFALVQPAFAHSLSRKRSFQHWRALQRADPHMEPAALAVIRCCTRQIGRYCARAFQVCSMTSLYIYKYMYIWDTRIYMYVYVCIYI